MRRSKTLTRLYYIASSSLLWLRMSCVSISSASQNRRKAKLIMPDTFITEHEPVPHATDERMQDEAQSIDDDVAFDFDFKPEHTSAFAFVTLRGKSSLP